MCFKLKVSGEPQPKVTWYHDGEPVKADYASDIESDGSLAIPSAELKHSGVYKAVATNQHGSEERELKLMVNEEGGASTPVAIDDTVSSRPIPIPEFGKYVAELHANSNQPFKDLFQVGTCLIISRIINFFNINDLHRLWTLEREDTVLNMPQIVRENPSTDLEILLFVSDQ